MAFKKFEQRMAEHFTTPQPKVEQKKTEKENKSWLLWGLIFLILLFIILFTISR